ncbi:MAG TPA: hypothetical protein VGL20_03860 [Candidatus Dormibacteraeota bacterium]
MSDVDPLGGALRDSLAYSADDHSAVMWVESSVEHHFPQATRDEVRIITAALTEALVATGLVHVGLPRGGAEFADEDVAPEEAGRRVLDGWDADPLPAQIGLWMRASIHGHAVVAGLQTDRVLAEARERALGAAAREGYRVGV